MAGSLLSPVRHARRTVALVVTVALLAGAVASAVGPTVVAATTNDRSNPEQLATGQTVETTLPEGENATHWYAVDVTAGHAVVAELNALNTTNRTVKVQLYDASGDPVNEHRADQICGPDNLAGQVDCGNRTTAVAPNVAEYSGTYYVLVSKGSDPESDSDNPVPYNLTVRTHEMDSHDPNENGSTATPVALDEDVTGVGAVFDQDVYAVDLEPGVNYTVVVNTTDPDGSETFSKRLLVGTEAANVTDAEWGDPHDRNYTASTSHFAESQRLTFTAETAGTHYVVLGQSGLGYDLLEEDRYRLRVVRTTDEESGGGDGGSNVTATPTPTPAATATPSPTPTPTDGPVTSTATSSVSPTTSATDTPTPTPADGVATPAPTSDEDDDGPTPTKTIYPSRSPTPAGQAAQSTPTGTAPLDVGLGTLAAVLAIFTLIVAGVAAAAVATRDAGPDRL
jgi:hypothetical protein